MRALITGGAGFIGSNLAAELIASNHQVVVLDSLMSGFKSNLESLRGVTFIEGDVRDGDTVLRAIEGCEAVFHLAASVGNKRSIDHPITDAEINVLGTLRVLEAARQSRVRKVVISSSAGIFGELKTIPIGEDHPVEPDTPYGCTKLCEEKLGLAYAKVHSLEVVCLRYFNVYGPNQRFDAYGNVIPIFTFKLLRGEPITIFGDGSQTRDFIHVGDVVQANLKAAEASGLSGAFNIGSGTRVSIGDLAQALVTATGGHGRIERGPARKGDVMHSLADIQGAARAFGFRPSVALGEGLAGYVSWARTEKARS